MPALPETHPDTSRFSWDILAEVLDRRPALVVALLSVLYLILLIEPFHKILWHDELFTFYIAQSPTLASFQDAVRHVDWQPPLIFASVWISHRLFGIHSWSTRLPSAVAFYTASMLLFWVLRRRVGTLWAAVPVLLLWFSFYFKYATEARPYGLLLGFFALALFCYQRLSERPEQGNRWVYLAGFLIANCGMMMSHVLAPFSMMAFGIAELSKVVQQRKIDSLVWFSILAPLGLVFTYSTMIQGFEKSYFPPIFQASIRKIFVWYGKAVFYTMPGLLAAALLGWVIRRRFPEVSGSRLNPLFPRAHEVAILLALMLPPVLINLLMMRSEGAFWERYCITSAVALYVLLGLGLAWLLRFQRTAALTVLAVLLVVGAAKIVYNYRPTPPGHPLATIRPDLPMVAASGLAFLEMDHYEPPALLQRLFYLTDREAAIHYAHATLFEGFATLHQNFPLRATVEPYSHFVVNHKHFVVFGTQHYAEDWLLEKLADDGAQIKTIQNVRTPYRDYTVYDVQMP